MLRQKLVPAVIAIGIGFALFSYADGQMRNDAEISAGRTVEQSLDWVAPLTLDEPGLKVQTGPGSEMPHGFARRIGGRPII
jgi:hypothetical protein